jgi:uncharacterized protein
MGATLVADPLPDVPAGAFALLAADLELIADELAPETVIAGTPSVRSRELWTSADGRHESGVWEITPGVVSDVESAEVFVVISGRARVEVQDGPVLELAPGVVGSFPAGARTVWHVTDTLRKVYTVAIA